MKGKKSVTSPLTGVRDFSQPAVNTSRSRKGRVTHEIPKMVLFRDHINT